MPNFCCTIKLKKKNTHRKEDFALEEETEGCASILIVDNFPEHSDKKVFKLSVKHFLNTANIFILSQTQKRYTVYLFEKKSSEPSHIPVTIYIFFFLRKKVYKTFSRIKKNTKRN